MSYHDDPPTGNAIRKDNGISLSIDDMTKGLNDIMQTDDDDDPSIDEIMANVVDESTVIENNDPFLTVEGLAWCYQGSLIVLSGPVKSRKSLFAGIVTAGSIRTDWKGDIMESCQVANNPHRKAVIYFDNENPKRQFKNNAISIIKLAGYEKRPDHFYPIHLRKVPRLDRKKLAERYIRKLAKIHDGVHLIVIDGMADFISDTNDLADSTQIVEWVNGFQDKYQVTAIAIIHLNKNNGSERGHLGGELTKKADAIIRVRKEGRVSYLEAHELRDAYCENPPRLAFRQDDILGHPVGIIQDLPDGDERLKKIMNAVFGNGMRYRWGDARKAIMDYSGMGHTWSETTLSDLKKNEWIVNDGPRTKWRLNDN
jgi:hypothetical protein